MLVAGFMKLIFLGHYRFEIYCLRFSYSYTACILGPFAHILMMTEFIGGHCQRIPSVELGVSAAMFPGAGARKSFDDRTRDCSFAQKCVNCVITHHFRKVRKFA